MSLGDTKTFKLKPFHAFKWEQKVYVWQRNACSSFLQKSRSDVVGTTEVPFLLKKSFVLLSQALADTDFETACPHNFSQLQTRKIQGKRQVTQNFDGDLQSANEDLYHWTQRNAFWLMGATFYGKLNQNLATNDDAEP